MSDTKGERVGKAWLGNHEDRPVITTLTVPEWSFSLRYG